MRTNILSLIAVSIFLIFSLIGCAPLQDKAYSKASAPDIPEPSMKLKFSDIPVPSGFKLLASDSYCFQSGNIRAGVLVYKGIPNADKVVAFYKEQMPIYNWRTISIVEYGRRLLAFDRDNEACVINIEPRSLSTRITITLSPKQQISPVKSEKPIK